MTSCTNEKQAGVGGKQASESGKAASGTGSYSLEITPKNAGRSATLTLMPKGFELANAAITWMVNGRPFESALAQQLRTAELGKGDTVQARAIVKGSAILSDQITIMNTPPEIARVEVVPETVESRASLRVVASGRDIDDDPVTVIYEWINNNEPAGTGAVIEGTLKRGDFITVTITPFDGTDYGTAVIIRREIANMPPVIAAHKEFTFDGSVYVYQVKATDPDDDTLAYSLESPPNGMTIDSSTGLLKWVVPSEFKGKQAVSITVGDGHVGAARYSLEITIQ